MKTVALVGRPNVGKSRIFNRLLRRRHAIVEGTPGITRDRVEETVDLEGTKIRLIDTGGIGSDDPLGEQVKLQADVAISTADLILFVVDVREGMVPMDREIANLLRDRDEILVVANKVDTSHQENAWTDFAALGLGKILSVSAEHGRGFAELIDEIRFRVGTGPEEEIEEPFTRVAIVGRPNVGKSSLLNSIMKKERMIVSEVAGTTRDAVEEIVDLPQGRVALVDTAGIRKRRTDYSFLESLMVFRTRDAVGRSDVAVVVVDAVEGLTDQDIKILNAVFEQGKGAVLALNKWDAVEEKKYDKLIREIRYKLGSEAHVPIVSISALKNQRVTKVLEMALEVGQNMRQRISTADFNKLLADFSRRAPRGMRIKYGVQKNTLPPTFILFGAKEVPGSFAGFVKNSIRQTGRFHGVPIVVEFKR